jgi:predicted RND superfamily exporter protein
VRILIESQTSGYLTEPTVLRAIDDLQRFMAQDTHVGGVSSIVDHIKRLHQAMNQGDAAFYRVPDSKSLIDQYLYLYAMSAGPDGVSGLIDDDRTALVIRALSKTDSAEFSRGYLHSLQSFAAQRFNGLPVVVGIAAGTLGIQTAMNDVIVHEKIANMLQVTVIIWLLSSIVLRSLVGGLLVLAPLALAVIVNLGVMGWTQTWLDMTAAAFTAMGVSIGADFAIYLTFRVREELATARSLEDAVRQALQTSGKAIFFVSSAVALGYMVLPFAGFSLWSRLGVLTSILVSVSAAAALTVLPALLLLLRPRFVNVGLRAAETYLDAQDVALRKAL